MAGGVNASIAEQNIEDINEMEEESEVTVQPPSAKVNPTKQKKQLVTSLDLNKVHQAA